MKFIKLYIVLLFMLGLTACEKEHEIEQTIPAVPQVSPLRKMLNEHIKAESISDYLLRCNSMPLPDGVNWNIKTVEAFCEDVFTPTLSWREVKDLIENGKSLELDIRYDKIIAGYFAKKIPEGAMQSAYEYSFSHTSSLRERLIQQWLTASPHSAHALAARGILNIESAWQFRGDKWFNDTPPAQIIQMKAKAKLAIVDLKAAILINPKIIPAYRAMMSAAQLIGDEKLAHEYLEKAQAIDPFNYYVLFAYASQFEPKWGGSIAQMNAIAKSAQAMFAENPRMANLMTWSLTYPAFVADQAKDYKAAIKILTESVAYGPLYNAIYQFAYDSVLVKDHVKAVELYSELLRYRPNDASVYISRSKELAALGIFDIARDDLNRAKAIDVTEIGIIYTEIYLDLAENKPIPAQTKLSSLLNRDPNDIWALEYMVWLSIFKTQDEKLGREMIDRGLTLDPNSSVFCWLNWELVRRTNGSTLKEATEAFIKNIDKTDQRQVDALPYAKL